MADGIQPLRDALCWESLNEGCSADACELLHLRHAGLPVCGRHATSVLELWGRRRRPPCPEDCGRKHPTMSELETILADALPEGSRLYRHTHSLPFFEGSEPRGGAASQESLFVVACNISPEQAELTLAARSPMPLRVALDIGFDNIMSDSERKSLATQCGLCHGIASRTEHRPHVRKNFPNLPSPLARLPHHQFSQAHDRHVGC